jgi:lambda family phage minor tail protein L
MTKSSADINKQLISINPDAIIELYEIDFSSIQSNFDEFFDEYGVNLSAEPIYRFTPMINGNNPIVWQGKSYQPMPVKMEGFEHKTEGKLPRPTFSLANPEGIFSKIIYSNQDFLNCKVTRKRTFARFLDDDNFQNKNLNNNGGNPFGHSDVKAYFPEDIYYINRKTLENKEEIQFELVSPLELENAWIPARNVLSNYCNWTYRCSVGCGYKGLAIETLEGQDLTKGFAFKPEVNQGQRDYGLVNPKRYTKMVQDVPSEGAIPEWKINDNYQLGDLVKITPGHSDSPYAQVPQIFVCTQSHSDAHKKHPYFSPEYWLKDECAKTVDACKKRFSTEFPEYSQYNQIEGTTSNDQGIRFGGFPGTEAYPFE